MPEAPERHATWPELFFDLVAVAGVNVLAHELEVSSSWVDLGTLAVAFTAFWLLWAGVTTYGSIAAERTRLIVIFATMGLMVVMIAAVPQIDGEHTRAFAIAYIVGRLIVAGVWRRGSVVVDLPVVQAGLGVLPWVISLWIVGEQRYAWWAAGIVLDLIFMLGSTQERLLGDAQRRLERAQVKRRTPPRRAEDHADEPIRALAADPAHLTERMGLFVLIVLGEAMIQLAHAAGEAEWGTELLWTTTGAFAVVLLLFWLLIVHGTAGIALLQVMDVPLRLMWVGHLLTAIGLVVLGAGLGELVGYPTGEVGLHEALRVALPMAVVGLVSAITLFMARGAAFRALAPVMLLVPTLMAAGICVWHALLTPAATAWVAAASLVVVLAAAVLTRERTAT